MTKGNQIVRSMSRTLLGSSTIIWMAVRYLARIVRPTLIYVLVINTRMSKVSLEEDDCDEKKWHKRLIKYDTKTREMMVEILLSIYESDQSRVLGIESKARGVMTAASLVLVVNIAVLNYSIRENLHYIVLVLIGLSFVYLVTALLASFRVEKTSPRWILGVDEVFSQEIAVYKLAEYIEKNRYYETARTNLTESAIFDIARAFVVAILAIILALIFSIT